MNTYDIINKMDAIVTINSKVGAEALSQYKKVLVLGDAFYNFKCCKFELISFFKRVSC